ncbi:MAG: nickel-dependent lactate racemase [Syntrophales bacterium]|nr:nickel-dependent lactate racemase [Syntrophales bacterium]
MKIEIPWGEKVETVTIPADWQVEVISPREVSAKDPAVEIIKALDAPVGAPPFSAFIAPSVRPCLVVNDATRPTPTADVLRCIRPALTGKDVKILVATGSHRAPTEEEYRFIFRDLYDWAKEKVVVHDAKRSACRFLGKTRFGNDIHLNAHLWTADSIIPIGSVEPHYFAGYTGGRKSLMPGVASYESIQANHRLAISPDSKLLVLEGNPVAEDLNDAEELMLDTFNIFSIMTVLDGVGQLYAARAGHLKKAFRSLLPLADEVFVVPIRDLADVIVTVAREPLDIDLYQSQKALENVRDALKPDGVLILVSACRSGVGSEAFLELLASEETPEAVVRRLTEDYRLGYHKAGKMAELAMRCHLWAVTPLAEETIRKAKMRPIGSVSQALKEAARLKGPGTRLLVFMDGGMTVPRLEAK